MAAEAPSLKLIANGAFAARMAASLTEWRGVTAGVDPAALPMWSSFVLGELAQYTKALLQSESLPLELEAFRRRFPTTRSLIDYLRVLHACAPDRRFGEYFQLFLGAHLVMEGHSSFGEAEFARVFHGKVDGADRALAMIEEAPRLDPYDAAAAHALLLRVADRLESPQGTVSDMVQRALEQPGIAARPGARVELEAMAAAPQPLPSSPIQPVPSDRMALPGYGLDEVFAGRQGAIAPDSVQRDPVAGIDGAFRGQPETEVAPDQEVEAIRGSSGNRKWIVAICVLLLVALGLAFYAFAP